MQTTPRRVLLVLPVVITIEAAVGAGTGPRRPTMTDTTGLRDVQGAIEMIAALLVTGIGTDMMIALPVVGMVVGERLALDETRADQVVRS